MVRSWTGSARGLALVVLLEIVEEGAYSNIALNKHLSSSQLSPIDKELVTELVYGTIARKLTLEWYLAHVIADRDRLDSWVYYLLMLSLYQGLYLDRIPRHAIVYEAVELAKAKKAGTDKFVNAMLRQLLDKPLPDPSQIKRRNKRYAIQYSLPVWLIQTLIENYGEERAEAICRSLQVRSKASVRVTDPQRLDEIAQATGSQPSEIAGTGLTKPKGHFAQTSYFREGLLTIQDETSQLVAPTLSLKGHEEVLDACAAPGGKTVHLASYLTTGRITALDLYDHKLDLIKENASRLQLADKIETKKLDARQVHEHFPADSFDAILVDAPCSGIGLIRRKPDIRYNKASSDFESLQAIQLEILDSVCQTLKQGGIITYSTCTIVDKENREVVQQFLATHPHFEQVPLTHDKTELMQDGCLLVTPEQFMTDGFFIAQMRRKS